MKVSKERMCKAYIISLVILFIITLVQYNKVNNETYEVCNRIIIEDTETAELIKNDVKISNGEINNTLNKNINIIKDLARKQRIIKYAYSVEFIPLILSLMSRERQRSVKE